MTVFPIEFWVIIQMVIVAILVFFIVFYIKRMKTAIQKEVTNQIFEDVVRMIEPLLQDATRTANIFEDQIREKTSLINKLNGKLDSRIISLNLLLNRSESSLSSLQASRDNFSETASDTVTPDTYDQQQSILELYENGATSDQIAQQLSIAKGEVDLVINLRKKFLSSD